MIFGQFGMTVRYRCGQSNDLSPVWILFYLLMKVGNDSSSFHGQIKCCKFLLEVMTMEGRRLLRYSMQLSMLKQLLSMNLINDYEYKRIKKRLMRDYGVVSNITA